MFCLCSLSIEINDEICCDWCATTAEICNNRAMDQNNTSSRLSMSFQGGRLVGRLCEQNDMLFFQQLWLFL